MRIRRIETTIVRAVGPSVFVRVHTDEGLVGLGECYPSAPADGIARTVHHLAEQLVGENPLDVDALWERVRRAYLFRGAQGGALITALSGVEMALWDLAGKALGVPVYRLLGGRFREKVRLYCDTGYAGSPHAHVERVRGALSQGFTAVKMDLDPVRRVIAAGKDAPHLAAERWNWTVTPAELALMVDSVAAVREAIGPVDLAVDLHGRYDAASGARIAQALEPYGLLWLEEPVPPENPAALARVRESTRTPICVGENAYTRWAFRELLERQATDVVMPDLARCGGLSDGRKIANLAELYYVSFAPHQVSSPVGAMAAAHVCASVPNFLVLEFHGLDVPHWESLADAGPVIQDGYIHLRERPGLGVDLNHDVARRHLHTRMCDTYFDLEG